MQIKIKDSVKRRAISEPKQLAEILTKVLKAEKETDREKEHFWGVYFNSRLNIKKIELISLGVVNGSMVHPRETFRPGVECSASSLIVIHNHPSEGIEPSPADIDITHRLKKAGQILGIELDDHIIIDTKDNHFSFKASKLI